MKRTAHKGISQKLSLLPTLYSHSWNREASMHKPFLGLLCLLHTTLDQIPDKHLPKKLKEINDKL